MIEPTIHVRQDRNNRFHYCIICGECSWMIRTDSEGDAMKGFSEHKREAHPPIERNTKTKALRNSY